jgi:hypothetical protein
MDTRTAAENDLAKARRHVEDAQRLVWQQKGRIVRLREAGRDTMSAEKTLSLLESNLQTFREHQSALEYNQLSPEGPHDSTLRPRLLAAE